MSFANALNILRPTLPYYVALTKHGLLRLTRDRFEFHPHPAAPPFALEMAQAVAQRVLTMHTVGEIRGYLTRKTRQICPNVAFLDVQK